MAMTKEQLNGLARRRRCPRCDFEKTFGNALCRRCRTKLPTHMRSGLERIPNKEPWTVTRALRAAASYFEVHFASVRRFGGGRKRR
jgi:predicted amidophosphoribosyltransferase